MLEIREDNFDIFAFAGNKTDHSSVQFLENLLSSAVLSGHYRDLQEIAEMMGLHGFSIKPLVYEDIPWEVIEESPHKPSVDSYLVLLVSAFNEELAHLYVTFTKSDREQLRLQGLI